MYTECTKAPSKACGYGTSERYQEIHHTSSDPFHVDTDGEVRLGSKFKYAVDEGSHRCFGALVLPVCPTFSHKPRKRDCQADMTEYSENENSVRDPGFYGIVAETH